MGDADKTFKVRIENEADTSPIEKERAELAKLKQEAGATSPAAAGVSPAAGITAETEAAAGSFDSLGLIAGGALAGIVLAGTQVYNTLREINEFQAKLTEEINKETNALDAASRKWNELASSAASYKDITRIAGDVTKELEAVSEKTRALRAESTTISQQFTDALSLLVGLTQGIPQIWLPYTKALQDAEAEQEKLTSLTVEFGRNAIESGERAKVAWEAVKLETVTQGIAEYTAKLNSYKDAQAAANLNTEEGSGLYHFYGQKISETQAKLDELTGTQDKLASSSDRVSEELERIDLSKLAPIDQLDALKNKLDEIQQSLRELGVNAASPNDALKQAANLTAEDAAEAIKLAEAWARVGQQIDKTTKTVSDQADKAIKDSSAQVKAVIANQDAATKARAEGNDKDADLFQKSADQFKAGMNDQQRAELENIQKLRGESKPPQPVGRKAGVGESQEKVDEIERNRLAAENQPVETGSGGPSLIGADAEAARKKDLGRTAHESKQAAEDREESNARLRGENRAGEIERQTQDANRERKTQTENTRQSGDQPQPKQADLAQAAQALHAAAEKLSGQSDKSNSTLSEIIGLLRQQIQIWR